MGSDNPPLPGADVALLCRKRTACSIAKTDVNGEFIFRSLSPGTFSMRVRLRGFYPVEQFDLAVRPNIMATPNQMGTNRRNARISENLIQGLLCIGLARVVSKKGRRP